MCKPGMSDSLSLDGRWKVLPISAGSNFGLRNPRREALLALRALLTCFHSGVRGRTRRRVKTQVGVGCKFRAAGNGKFAYPAPILERESDISSSRIAFRSDLRSRSTAALAFSRSHCQRANSSLRPNAWLRSKGRRVRQLQSCQSPPASTLRPRGMSNTAVSPRQRRTGRVPPGIPRCGTGVRHSVP